MSLIVEHLTTDYHDDDDDESLIEGARKVLKHACDESRWASVLPPSASQLVCFHTTDNVYKYALNPPHIQLEFHTEDLPEFDVSQVFEREIVRLEDLEEFKHEYLESEDYVHDGLHSHFSTESMSLFFQQHQPEAQSTPAFSLPNDHASLDLVSMLQQAETILKKVPPPTVGGILQETSNIEVVSDPPVSIAQGPFAPVVNDAYTYSDFPAGESLRNHSAYNPPSRSTTSESSSCRHPPQDPGAQSTSQREIRTSPELRFTEPALHVTNGDIILLQPPPSPPPQPAPHSSGPTPSSGNKSYPPLPIPEWSTPPQSSYTHHRHATPAFSSQPRHSNSNRNPESLGSPIYSYSGPNREPTPSPQHEPSVYGSQYPRFYSPSRDEPQPEAYLPQPQDGDISVDHPRVTPDNSFPSQPSAYNADPPVLNSAPRILAADIAFASVAYPSSPRPPLSASLRTRLDEPPLQHDTSDPIISSSSLEIPGLGMAVILPPLSPPSPRPLQKSNVDKRDSTKSSSPIQDFTTTTTSTENHAVNVPSRAPGAGIGPKWKFPLATTHDGDRAKDKGKDVSSSPIQEFSTILEVEPRAGGLGVSNEGPPGLVRGGQDEVLDISSSSKNPSVGVAREERRKEADSIPGGGSDHPPSVSVAVEHPASWGTGIGLRAGEGAQPRDDDEHGLSEGESIDELYGGLEGGAEYNDGQGGGQLQGSEGFVGKQPRLTRMSTDEELYGESFIAVEAAAGVESLESSAISNAQNERGEVVLASGSDSVNSKRSRSPDVNAVERLKKVEEKTTSPSRKRRRMELQPLYELIPEPHIYTAPIPLIPTEVFAPTLPTDEASNKTYTTLHSPTILPSSTYTAHALPTLFKDPYARCGWIIPVRGTPPFLGCTTASVVAQSTTSETSSEQVYDGDVQLSSGPTSNVTHPDSPGCITWTADALRAFWAFLVAVREARKMGPIGLSFHCSNTYSASPSFANSRIAGKISSDESRDRFVGSSDRPKHQETGSEPQKATASSLREVDYVKIYVDAPYAPKMRDVLHAWGYECECSTSSDKGRDVRRARTRTRVRIFRDAKLVLVDERNKGVLVW